MLRWFGKSWRAPICKEPLRAEPPFAEECAHCNVKIKEENQAVLVPICGNVPSQVELPVHLDCFIEMVAAKRHERK